MHRVSLMRDIFVCSITYRMKTKKKIKFNSTIKKRTILKASDYSLDISKLILAGVVLAGVVDLNVNKAFLLVSGIAVVFIFALVGFFLYILGNQSKL